MLVLVCTEFDEVADSCVTQEWLQNPTVLPPLSVSDGLELMGVIGLVWATCFGLRLIARFIWRG